jgi:hypothetical protein
VLFIQEYVVTFDSCVCDVCSSSPSVPLCVLVRIQFCKKESQTLGETFEHSHYDIDDLNLQFWEAVLGNVCFVPIGATIIAQLELGVHSS